MTGQGSEMGGGVAQAAQQRAQQAEPAARAERGAHVQPGQTAPSRGPLSGLRVIEFAGLGPAPFAAMMLADHGAQVIRIARPAAAPVGGDVDLLARGRLHLGLDLKRPEAIEVVLRLIESADALIEGFRPGVMERLGLGPQACLQRNPRLVYGRATGWGQSGPLAMAAGHDINYTALSGTLHAVGKHGEPTPVPGFVGDFGGGGMMLAFGVLAAMLEAGRSGQGQVIDAAVSDGAALLATLVYGWRSAGQWNTQPGSNMGDGGAPFYNTYRCSDGRYISVGAIEPQFHRELLTRCGIAPETMPEQWNPALWPQRREQMAALFVTRTRDEWCALLEGSDACFAPVLDLDEAPAHPHNVARAAFSRVDGILQPNPAPRFSRTVSAESQPVRREGSDTDAVLQAAGFSAAEIERLLAQSVVWQAR